MKTFEVWNIGSNGRDKEQALHIMKAAKLHLREGHYLLMDEDGMILHAIQTSPNLLIRTADEG